jgi:hypothetical protein
MADKGVQIWQRAPSASGVALAVLGCVKLGILIQRQVNGAGY